MALARAGGGGTVRASVSPSKTLWWGQPMGSTPDTLGGVSRATGHPLGCSDHSSTGHVVSTTHNTHASMAKPEGPAGLR